MINGRTKKIIFNSLRENVRSLWRYTKEFSQWFKSTIVEDGNKINSKGEYPKMVLTW